MSGRKAGVGSRAADGFLQLSDHPHGKVAGGIHAAGEQTTVIAVVVIDVVAAHRAGAEFAVQDLDLSVEAPKKP